MTAIVKYKENNKVGLLNFDNVLSVNVTDDYIFIRVIEDYETSEEKIVTYTVERKEVLVI